MQFHELASFDVAHHALPWPWVTLAGRRLAYATAADRIEAFELVDGAKLEARATFALPAGFALPTEKDGPGLRAFALSPDGTSVAALDGETVVTLGTDGEIARTTLEATGCAVSFDRTGARLWIATEAKDASSLVVLDAATHDLVATLRWPALPGPAVHELFVHPVDDAVLHVAAAGDDQTFVRVAGWASGPPAVIETALDGGSLAAGFVGFSRDGARAHFAEPDELRTHAWPTLHELSSVPFAAEFTSSYAGAVLGDRVYVDGIDVDDEGDLVMLFDRSAIVGGVLRPPFPLGMWAGKLGGDVIVAIEHDRTRGGIARGRLYRIPAPLS